MNTLVLGGIAIGLFLLGYIYYGRRIEKLYGIDPSRKTPALENFDGVDYIPARHWFILFGHHFAAIAGAAPIIGPVIAVAFWGWGPALAWIVLGSILIGGVHDFGALMASVRHKGRSIAEVAGSVISRRARLLFSVFVWLTLVLVVAVFVFFSAKTYVEKPEIVLPSLGLIPIALLTGFLLYNLKLNQIGTTILAFFLMLSLIILGNYLPIDLGQNALSIWILVLIGDCFFASVIPVQILLQPRDYLCGLLIMVGIIFGYGGLCLTHPSINIPFYSAWKGEGGVLWPMLFVTIACGAISGFHSLVASGTTSKQLPGERDAKRIGYLAMLLEGIVATLALLAIVGGFKEKEALLSFISPQGKGPVAAFGQGYQILTKPIFGPYGALVAITILNALILSSLDAATRIGRYVIQELFKIKDRYVATLIMVILSSWLALSGKWRQIWPIFGASNQLLAALSLIVITSWLLSRKRLIRYTLIPAIFMLLTTIGALICQFFSSLKEGEHFLVLISLILIGLGLFVIIEAMNILKMRHFTSWN